MHPYNPEAAERFDAAGAPVLKKLKVATAPAPAPPKAGGESLSRCESDSFSAFNLHTTDDGWGEWSGWS